MITAPPVLEGRAFIDGRYRACGQPAQLSSPINGKAVGEFSTCQGADVDAAVQAARSAFSDQRWCGQAPAARKRILLQLADRLEQQAATLAWMDTYAVGLCIQDSLQHDLPAAVRALRWSAEAVDKIQGAVAPVGQSELGLITREPVGVAAAIVPWNFPLVTTCWKLGPALAAGNSVILKPSERSPFSAIALAGLAQEAGLPNGVLQVLPGTGPETGRALAEHPGIDALLFTGSTAVGKKLLQAGAASNMKRVWVECGGKSPQLVFADCHQLEKVAAEVATGIFSRQGQICSAGSRLLVEEEIFDVFLERVLAQCQHWSAGNPLDPQCRVGVMIDEDAVSTNLKRLTSSLDRGATLLTGGAATSPVPGSAAMQPTIVLPANNEDPLLLQELFAPILCCQKFRSEQEALHLANAHRYGLAAGVYTRDLNRAHRVAAALRCGSVWINGYFGGDMTAPFSGFRESGNGCDKSLLAFDKVTEVKSTWIQLA